MSLTLKASSKSEETETSRVWAQLNTFPSLKKLHWK